MIFTPVMETYLGKSKNLQEGVECIRSLIKNIEGKDYLDLAKLNIDQSSDNKRLNELLRKEFNFKTCNIYWDSSYVPNAFTVTGGLFVNPRPYRSDDDFKKNNKFKDENGMYLCHITVMSGLVNRAKLTAEEVMAIILHEIGHNFDNTTITLMRDFALLWLTSFMMEFTKLIGQIYMAAMSSLQQYLPYFKKLLDLRDEVMYELSAGKFSIDLNKVNPLYFALAPLGYGGETFADRFVTTHGFGPHLASAMSKMDRMNMTLIGKGINQIPVLRTIYDAAKLSLSIPLLLIDPHPLIITRIANQIDKLEKDLEDPKIPKALKSDMQKDLIKTRKVYNDYINMEQEGKDLLASYAMRKTGDRLFGGKLDVREYISRVFSTKKDLE